MERHYSGAVVIVDTPKRDVKLEVRKAFSGPNRAPTELHKVALQEVARLVNPLIVKSCMTLRPPIQWNGGDVILW